MKKNIKLFFKMPTKNVKRKYGIRKPSCNKHHNKTDSGIINGC